MQLCRASQSYWVFLFSSPPKGSISALPAWTCMWFLASSGPLGLAVFFTHTLGIDVQGCSFFLLHLLGRDLALSLGLADGGSFLFSAPHRLLLRTNPSRVLLAVQGYLASWLDLLPLLPWLVGSESLLTMAPRELVPAKPLFQFSPWLSVLPLSFSSAHFVLSLFYPGRVLVLLWTMGVIMGNQDPRIKKRGGGFRGKESMLQICCLGHCEHWAGCAS